MTDASRVRQVAERLRASITERVLPASALPGAQALLDRFDRPLRLALMGLPEAGKSAVLNLLVGETVVPDRLTLPRLQLRQGSTPEMTLFFSDGSSDRQPGRDLEAAAALGPVSVTLDLPLQSLALINPMELSAGASVNNQARALTWASKHADIFIWCSEAFTEIEQLLWQDAPTVVKDQGLLLITKTDLRGNSAELRAFVNRIVQMAGDEFSTILPLSTGLARRAFAADGSFDRDLFRSSGAPGLVAEIKSQIEKIRQADVDTAVMLLLHNTNAAATVAPKPAVPVVPKPDVPKPVEPKALAQPSERLILTPQLAITPIARVPKQPVQTTTPTPPPVQVPRAPAPFSAQLAQLAQRRLKPSQAEVPLVASSTASAGPILQQAPSASAIVRSGVTSQEKLLLRQAVDALVDRANVIQSGLPATGKTHWPQIVSQTADAVASVAQLLQTSESPAPRAIARDVAEVQDLLTLIQLEPGSGPANDAISLLIQLKRDLEFALAA